jgi:hypothetical protein
MLFTFISVFSPAMMRNTVSNIKNIPLNFDRAWNKSNTGFYLFGGKTNKDDVLNDFHILSIVDEPDLTLKWTRITIQGSIPKARYSHCMMLVDRKILIYGGRNDNLY